MLIGCVNAYEEEALLPGCLESIRTVCERIVVVDGAYERFPFPAGHPESTDATRAIARCYGAEVVECPYPRAWPTQQEKRSQYLRGDDGDWYLVIDADERLLGSLPDLDSLDPDRSYRLLVTWADRSFDSWACRLFACRGDMEYRGAHCALFARDELISRPRDAVSIESAHLLHLKGQRTELRQIDKIQYYAWQKRAEREFRRKWSI